MSNYPTKEPSNYMNIDNFGGVNWFTNASRINDNEATLMENFIIAENGVLRKRTGTKKVLRQGNLPVFKMIEYKGKIIMCLNAGAFEFDPADNSFRQLTQTGCLEGSNLFIMNGLLFIMGVQFFYYYDGTTAQKVENNAYIPTLFITTPPAGGGVPYEQWNMLSSSFKQSFNADGETRTFTMCMKNVTPEKVTINGVEKEFSYTDGTDGYTNVNVDPKGPIPEKGTDNIVITCGVRFGTPLFDKVLQCKARINGSTIYSFYGGENDTRLLLAGQDSVFYRSDVYNPFYFPENYYQSVGDTEEKITGFVTQYDYCVILKEKSIWYTRYELLQNGTSAYTTKPLNSQFGCINPNSIQLVENSPIFMSEKGLAIVNQTQVRDERNVTVISEKINETEEMGYFSLLSEDLTKGSSIDYDNKYMYGINNRIYIYDYLNQAFYMWILPSDIVISCFIEVAGKLYIGANIGTIYTIKGKDEENAYYDEYANVSSGNIVRTPIKCSWKSKLFSFGNYNTYKLIENLFISISPSEKTSVNIKYVTDNNTIVQLDTVSNNLFDYSTTNYSIFSYITTRFPVVDNMKVKAKKILFFQIIFENSNPLESLEIYNLGIKFRYQREVKP